MARSRKPPRELPFERWPGNVQAAFEKYYALEPVSRRLDTAAALSGHSRHQIERWSSRYGWSDQVDARDRALAAEQRARSLTQRRRVMDAAESGVGSLITRYSAAAKGTCPTCMGKGTLKRGRQEILCTRCEGSGLFDPMNLNVLAFDRALARYGAMVGELGDEGEAADGAISHEEFIRLQRDMLRRAGADADAAPAPIVLALPAAAEDDRDDD